jgi:hypothetical protein
VGKPPQGKSVIPPNAAPDEVFETQLFKIERFGRRIQINTSRSKEDHQKLIRSIIEHRPELRARLPPIFAAGVPGRKSPISHLMRVLFQDYGLAPLRRTALLARKLVRSSVQLAVVPPLLPYAANFRD